MASVSRWEGALFALLRAERADEAESQLGRESLLVGLPMLAASACVCVLLATPTVAGPMGILRGAWGRLGLQALLVAVFLSWLGLPLLRSGLGLTTRSLRPRDLLAYPVADRDLLLFAFAAMLTRRSTVQLALLSLCCLAPCLFLPAPVSATGTGLMFLTMTILLSWGLSQVLAAILTAGRTPWLVMPMGLLLSAVVFTPAVFEAVTTERGIELHGLGGQFLLVSPNGLDGLFPLLMGIFPGTLVLKAGLSGVQPTSWLILATMGLGGFCLGLLGHRRCLRVPPTAPRRKTSLPLARLVRAMSPPGPLGIAVERESRCLLSTTEATLGLAVSLLAALLIPWSPHPLLMAGLVLALLVGLSSALTFNAFGLDREAVDAHFLGPLSGRDTLLAKNLSYFFLLGLQSLPVVVACLATLELQLTLGLAFLFAALATCMACGGVVHSVKHPVWRSQGGLDSSAKGQEAWALFTWTSSTLLLFLGAALFHVVQAVLGGPWFLLPGLIALAVMSILWRRELGRAGRLLESRGARGP